MKYFSNWRLIYHLALACLIVLFSLNQINGTAYFSLVTVWALGYPYMGFYRLKQLGLIDQDQKFFQTSYFKIISLGWKNWFRFHFGKPVANK
jgi:hypothetical protein